MFNQKSMNLSLLLGLYLLLSVIGFSTGLLMWTYHTSKQAINQELRTAFMQRHVVAENIMERQHELIRMGLYRIMENQPFVSAVSRKDQPGTKEILLNLLTPATNDALDILFVSLPGHPVWADMSSPFFASGSILPGITAYAEKLLSSGRILRLKKDEADLTMMLQAVPIIRRQTGRVLGTLFGGVVLNDNFSLLELIRKKTMSEMVIFLEDGDMIASTNLPDARIPLIFQNTEGSLAGQVYPVDGLLTHYQRVSVLDQPSSLTVLIGVTDKIRNDLKASYQQKGIFLLFFSLCFLIFTVFMIRWLTFPSLEKLLRYSREISHGNLKARYQQGIISEFNQLGHATEKMVGALQDTRERFATFMDNLPLGAFIKDEHSVVCYVNQYLKDVFDAEKWTDKNICEIMSVEIADRLRADDLKGLEAPIILEEIMQDKNGLPRIYETRKFPIRQQGKAPLLGGIAIEITERKKAEENLRKAQQYVKNIIDSMPSALVSVDPDGQIIEWNTEAEKISPVGLGDAKGRHVQDIFSQLAGQLEGIRGILQRGVPVKHEKCPLQIRGETRYTDVVIYPLVANGMDGSVIRIDDVTQRVRIEEMMIQTEKMMSVGGLAAGMAHEINNPLGVILQGVQGAHRRLSPELQKNIVVAQECGTDLESIRAYLEKRSIIRYLDGISEAGLRAAKIVENMLNFSRRNDAARALHRISDILEESIELASSDYDLKKKYDFRKISIIRDYDPHLPEILINRTEVEQVFFNLLQNATHAIAQGTHSGETPRIILRTKTDGEFVRIEIEDNGPGMGKDVRKRVFEPFFTTKDVGVGTGLGLSVSYFIITSNHKGEFRVESEPGGGAKFIIQLPLNLHYS